MKRMTCIGAQYVPATELTTPPPRIEMPCRRDNGHTQQRTFYYTPPMDAPAVASLQLPLFDPEESFASTDA